MPCTGSNVRIRINTYEGTTSSKGESWLVHCLGGKVDLRSHIPISRETTTKATSLIAPLSGGSLVKTYVANNCLAHLFDLGSQESDGILRFAQKYPAGKNISQEGRRHKGGAHQLTLTFVFGFRVHG